METLVLKCAAAAVAAAVLALFLKDKRPDFAIAVTMAAGVFIVLTVLPTVKGVITALDASKYGEGASGYAAVVVKVVGLAYIAEFGSQICADADAKALAANVELAGKVAIMSVAAPIILDLLNRALAL